MENGREEGVVKWFNAQKGYGFIGRSDGTDIFVHFSAIEMDGYKKLQDGSKVSFEVMSGEKGKLQAGNVRTIA